MKLGNIANVRSGLVLSRKQAREYSEIQYPLLNFRAINASGYVKKNELDVFNAAEYLSKDYLSQEGDIIVRLTAPYTAILIDKETEGMVISSNFLIIRTDYTVLLPEYLFWLLNSAKVKKSIYENTSSNMLGAIKTKFFSDFEVHLLSIKEQRKIAEMNALALREAILLQRLAEEKEKYYGLLIEQTHNEMKRGNIYDES